MLLQMNVASGLSGNCNSAMPIQYVTSDKRMMNLTSIGCSTL